MSSLAYEAFNLYVQDQRMNWNVPQGVPNPAGLTFENWIKTSTLIEEYMELARDRRNDRPKSIKQLNDEHSQWLSQRLSKTQKPTQRKGER